VHCIHPQSSLIAFSSLRNVVPEEGLAVLLKMKAIGEKALEGWKDSPIIEIPKSTPSTIEENAVNSKPTLRINPNPNRTQP